jgi:hypothetical protein
MADKQQLKRAIKRAFKFNTYAAASSFSLKTIKATAVLLGDDGLFWVVTITDMEKLTRAGYEVAG